MEVSLIEDHHPSLKELNTHIKNGQKKHSGSNLQQPFTDEAHYDLLMSTLTDSSDGNNNFRAEDFYLVGNNGSLVDMENSMMMDCDIPDNTFLDSRALYWEPPDLSGSSSESFHPPTPLSVTLDTSQYPFPSVNQFDSRPSDFQSPITYSTGFQEHEAVIVSQKAWSIFRCNPPLQSRHCPRTARIYLEGLEQTLTSADIWSSCELNQENTIRSTLTESLSGWEREKLVAITQTFLHRALKVHRNQEDFGFATPHSLASNRTSFIVLPPPQTLDHFLHEYLVRFRPYHIFINAGMFRPNDLMHQRNGNLSCIFLLLMFAHGASATPKIEAMYLSSGLTEVCRISLSDLIEKDIIMSSDPDVLRCALLLTTLALWSGDKWHMDVCFPLFHRDMIYQLTSKDRSRPLWTLYDRRFL